MSFDRKATSWFFRKLGGAAAGAVRGVRESRNAARSQELIGELNDIRYLPAARGVARTERPALSDEQMRRFVEIRNIVRGMGEELPSDLEKFARDRGLLR